MKHLAYLFAFLLLLTSVSAVCYNHEDSPFCSKDDSTCAVEDEADNDADGWSNSCDAFPDNEYLWVDYDGDNIGYGTLVYDCNDIDATIQTYCGQTDLLEMQDEEEIIEEEVQEEDTSDDQEETDTSEDSQSTGSSSGSSSSSNQFFEPRPKKNTGVTIYPPQEEDLVEEEVLVAIEEDEEEQETFIEREVVPLVDPTPINEPIDSTENQITGAVTGTSSEIIWWPIILLVAILFFLFLFARRKKKSEE